MSLQPLDYQPPPAKPGRPPWLREALAYAVFFISAGISASFVHGALVYNGKEEWFLCVFFGLCALVLPFLIRGK